jgi:hypothetical protein
MADIVEFDDWIQKGLGRAVVYLREHDPNPLRQAVLHACTHQTRDLATGGNRTEYCRDLMLSIGDEEFFRTGIFQALTVEAENPKEFDLDQTIELAASFAQNGDSEIKNAMYAAVKRAGFARAGCCVSDLIKLDGIDALLFAADLFPSDIEDNDLWQVGHLVSSLQERDGTEPADQAIEHASRDNPRLRRMLEVYEADLKESKKGIWPRIRPDYAELKRLIAEHGAMGYLSAWGRSASAEELEMAADDLIDETDPGRIFAYLKLFHDQRFPRPADRLLELADHSEIRIARYAVGVLSQLKSPAIRNRALSYLALPARAGDAADLLASNYQTGDFQLIEAKLREPMDAEDLHRFGMGVKHLLAAHCPKEAEQSLLLLYENGYCSQCRHTFVERLIQLQGLPDSIRSECRFDAWAGTRQLVQ